MRYEKKCQLPMFVLSSQIRRHRRSLFDQIDLGITVAGNRSRVFQKNLIAARTASRWQTLRDGFRRDPVDWRIVRLIYYYLKLFFEITKNEERYILVVFTSIGVARLVSPIF